MDEIDSPAAERNGSEVAIIAMAGRFPGAPDLERFWDNLRDGVESIRALSDEELMAAGVPAQALADPSYVKVAPTLAGIELFDAPLFGLAPREARILDPQQRLFLECAWEALERAGYDPASYAGLIGVFAGAERSLYLRQHLLTDPEILSTEAPLNLEVANTQDYLATRVSYELDLRGPSLTVQTACSTSLVAAHLACQSLLTGECDIALAGGITLRLPQIAGYRALERGIKSPDGHCRAFDAGAHGTVFGSGVGLVVLKRLEDALADGDNVRAVIRGSAVNNDGSAKVGYTAPGGAGQAQVVRTAHVVSEVNPDTITYVEAHGTGTALGDPIEVAALTQAFREATDRRGFCALGSVKTNIGHLQCAAGIAGLIKTVLALEHRLLPPSLHFERPNPQIDFGASPFYVNSRPAEWRGAPGVPLRAGVSAFGIGGTNAHLVVEEAPPPVSSGPSRPWQLLLLSAHTETALASARRNLGAHLESHPEIDLADAAYTLRVGRRASRYRAALACRDRTVAIGSLTAITPGASPERLALGRPEPTSPAVVFLFPGQGAQHPGMSRDVYAIEPEFRKGVDRCCEILRPVLGLDLRELLFPPAGDEAEAGRRLEQTALAQPALFTVEHALAELWIQWGVRPRAMLGHSVGELVAACLAGVFSLEDALALVAERGRLMQALPSGAMLSVPLPEAEVASLLGADLALAAVNAPSRTVVSGACAAVDALAADLAGRGVACRRLHTSHAFHSAAMEPALAPFAAHVAAVRRAAPVLPFVSNVTGTWITPEQAVDPNYWARQLRGTVRFADGLRTLAAEPAGATVLLEVGPGQTLSSFARRVERPAGSTVVRSLAEPREARSDAELLMTALGQLWLRGVAIDWPAFHAGERRRRVELPPYPFERQRYWVESRPAAAHGVATGGGLAARRELADWFYSQAWKPTAPPAPTGVAAGSRWLLLADREGLAEAMAERLHARGAEVFLAIPGDGIDGVDGAVFGMGGGLEADPLRVDPRHPEGFARLLAGLTAAGGPPAYIVHLWGVGELADSEAESLCFHALLRLGQALARQSPRPPVQLRVVTDGLQGIGAEGVRAPGKALVLGPVRVLPIEIPEIGCAAIDVALPQSGEELARLADALIDEALAPAAEPVVAWRGDERWVEDFTPVRLGAADPARPPLAEGAVCLITGGLTGVGLALARELAQRARARLVLIGRTSLPAPADWDGWLADHDESDPVWQRVQAVRELEALGAEVLPVTADVTVDVDMRIAVDRTHERFGPISAVVHAAGVPGGGVVQMRSAEAADRVLAPKVRGTRALATALAAEPLEWMVLCSSTLALLGGFGQIDYCAANSFLDAYARQAARRGTRVLSLAWSGWQEVGMAAASPRSRHSVHPLLSRRLAPAEGRGYSTVFSPARHWVLADHRFLGTPTMPGTAYLEMARAAFQHDTGAAAVEIRDALFLSPLLIADGSSREVRTLLDGGGEETTFRIVSRRRDGESWQEHARGALRLLAADARPAPVDLAAVAARCGPAAATATRTGALQWGPHWRCLMGVELGDGEALLHLELPPELAGDSAGLDLHPSLLDVATAGSSALTGGISLVARSHGRLRAFAPLAGCLVVHTRKLATAAPEIHAFDVTVCDSAGTVQVEVEQFVMIETSAGSTAGQPATPHEVDQSPAGAENPAAGAAAGAWMRPEEAIEAFRRALFHGRFAHLAVSPIDLPASIATARRVVPELAAAPSQRFPRPEIETAYASPTGVVEETLAEIWQSVLGLDRVGVDDNFFDLGGDSVVAIQMVAVAGRRGLQIAPELLFERQTIRTLAVAMAQELTLAEATPAVPPPVDAESGDFTLGGLSDLGLSEESVDRLLAKIRDRP